MKSQRIGKNLALYLATSFSKPGNQKRTIILIWDSFFFLGGACMHVPLFYMNFKLIYKIIYSNFCFTFSLLRFTPQSKNTPAARPIASCQPSNQLLACRNGRKCSLWAFSLFDFIFPLLFSSRVRLPLSQLNWRRHPKRMFNKVLVWTDSSSVIVTTELFDSGTHFINFPLDCYRLASRPSHHKYQFNL